MRFAQPAPVDAAGASRAGPPPGPSIDQLVVAFGAQRNAVGRWLARWQCLGLAGLAEGRRAGRPPKLSAAAQKK